MSTKKHKKESVIKGVLGKSLSILRKRIFTVALLHFFYSWNYGNFYCVLLINLKKRSRLNILYILQFLNMYLYPKYLDFRMFRFCPENKTKILRNEHFFNVNNPFETFLCIVSLYYSLDYSLVASIRFLYWKIKTDG